MNNIDRVGTTLLLFLLFCWMSLIGIGFSGIIVFFILLIIYFVLGCFILLSIFLMIYFVGLYLFHLYVRIFV
jgi:hypothetical protein